jgi:exonuclease III
MKNVDVEIYITQLINFFENNPNDLISLVGDVQKEDFYKKLRERCEKNLEEGKDIILSKDQIVSIVVDLKIPDITKQKQKYLDKIIQKTTFGEIILN